MFRRITLTPREEESLARGILALLAARSNKGCTVEASPFFLPAAFADLLIYVAKGKASTKIGYSEVKFIWGSHEVKTFKQRRIVRRKLRRVIRKLLRENKIHTEFLGDPKIIQPELGELSPHRFVLGAPPRQ